MSAENLQALRPSVAMSAALAPGIFLSAAVAAVGYVAAPFVAKVVPIPSMVIALVVGIFWFIPLHEVIESFRKVRVDLVVAAFLLNLLSAWLEGVQLWILLRRAKVPSGLWDVFETKMTTRFYAQFLPSELMAASVKFYRLAEPTKQWSEVMAALVFFRVVNMGALTLLGLAFWAAEMPVGPGRWIGR